MPVKVVESSIFLSTPSARRATTAEIRKSRPNLDFYPRPPRGGRRVDGLLDHGQRDISIHALREEGDKITFADLGWYEVFLSTPSARRATSLHFAFLIGGLHISIHALREEGDGVCVMNYREFLEFLSTPSARRAT